MPPAASDTSLVMSDFVERIGAERMEAFAREHPEFFYTRIYPQLAPLSPNGADEHDEDMNDLLAAARRRAGR